MSKPYMIYYMISCRLLEHPLLQDEKLEERRVWWRDYLAGEVKKFGSSCLKGG